jgi:hypothetical protein
MPEVSYNVAFRTMVGTHRGVVTWTAFDSKEAFDKWISGEMLDGSGRLLADVYDVVEEGVTKERAIELVSMPDSEAARYRANQGRREGVCREHRVFRG